MLLTGMGNEVLSFLLFSIGVVVIYYIVPQRCRTTYLLVANIIFYICCDWKAFFILTMTILGTWLCALEMEKSQSKGWLIAGISSLVLLLALFKYLELIKTAVNTLLDNVGMGSSSGVWNLIIPMGISYYLFKTISYLVDVYRGKYPAEKSILKYALYVSFFPEILCGPITRYNEFKDSMENGMNYSDENMQRGFYLVLKGVFMKVVIANRLSDYVTFVFSDPTAYTGIALWMAAFFYAVWLYCDFAGYSSIAIGITQLFGLHYKENFKRPYFSQNIHQFWDRWHISLSDWLRDYIYFPLGGSRCSKLKCKLNVMIVFCVSGLWHGSKLTFLFWGIYHGLLNILLPQKKKTIQDEKEKTVGIKNKVCNGLAIAINFSLVTIGWIFFGADSIKTAIIFIKSMFVNFRISISEIQNAILPFTFDNTCVAYFLVVMGFIFIFWLRELYEEKKNIEGMDIASVPWQTFLLVSIILFGSFNASGFVYANF